MKTNYIIFFLLLGFLAACSKKDFEKQEPLPEEAPVGAIKTFNSGGSTLVPGSVLEITGENFAQKPSDNVISVGGVQVSHVEVIEHVLPMGKKVRKLRTCIPRMAKTGEVILTVGKFKVELGQLQIKQYPDSRQWKRIPDYPGSPKTAGAVCMVINGKAYVGLGQLKYFDDGDQYNDFWEYDPGTSKWTRKADFPGGNRTGMVFFAVGGKGYVGLGKVDFNNPAQISDEKDFWEYDPRGDKWTKKGDFPGGRRFNSFATEIGDYGYVGGGYTNGGSTRLKDLWRYDPRRDKWEQKASFEALKTENFTSPTRFVQAGGKGYFFCGTMADDAEYRYRAFWEYDPQADRWSKKARFIAVPTGEFNPPYGTMANWDSNSMFGINGRVYLTVPFYNANDGAFANLQFEYSPEGNSWKQVQNFVGPTTGYTAFSIGSAGYSGLSHYQKDIWAFTP